MKLLDRIAIVTGGARGIGLAICRTYLEEGASVVIADIDRSAIDEALATLEIEGCDASRLMGTRLDVCDRRSIDAMVASVGERFGGIDILVNNAAVFDMAPVLEVTEASYDAQFAVNVKGLFFTLQAVAKAMVERAQGGRIINMASQAGRRGEPLVSTYCATKAAVISLTQSCALDLIQYGIRVNGIAPGVVDTPMWGEVDALFARYEKRPLGEKKRLVGEAVPYGRMGRPEDYAGPAVFLASDDSEYVVAQTLNVDGGNWMS
ncbi:L-iditol 2-dehydrogenase [Billgrantia gudaonensis]|uniref:D-sorbitol dehydrogenase (Acceptor) n=1 Tax=Billgrantia gudaonensis TaxID=376427 RepID=A0A1G8UI59_9GAMM|nr:L-iditol 2-dehydrogenase [Halomonas gudaonensis]SDJ53448.1 D-sorbitol dehydrogenase (acceptor) [Halomonas gudaonensis]